MIISGANTFAYDSSSGGQDEHMKVRMTDGYLRAISKGLAPEHSHGENVGCLYLDRNSIRALFREAQAILSAQGRGVWLASAVERAAEVRLRGIDVSDLPWVEIDFPEDLDIARRETWPAISLLPPRLAAASRSAVGIAQGVA